jgi:predicted N-formylglutamate amidohydrolase
MPEPELTLLLTCEHGGNRVPAKYAPIFAHRRCMLTTHRGWDPGAAALARLLARDLHAPLHLLTVTRMLVEVNRSIDNPEVFSSISRRLSPAQRDSVLRRYYLPHHDAVKADVARLIDAGRRVLHVGVHTFTPVRQGEVRRFDVGLLYDPRRPRERQLCQRWARALRTRRPGIQARFNAPYRGDDDGLTTILRGRFPADRYLGIELEVNQKHVRRGPRAWQQMQRCIVAALADVLGR